MQRIRRSISNFNGGIEWAALSSLRRRFAPAQVCRIRPLYRPFPPRRYVRRLDPVHTLSEGARPPPNGRRRPTDPRSQRAEVEFLVEPRFGALDCVDGQDLLASVNAFLPPFRMAFAVLRRALTGSKSLAFFYLTPAWTPATGSF